MAEIKKVWLVQDKIGGDTDELFTDARYETEVDRLNEFYEKEGLTIDRFVIRIMGTPGNAFEEENSKVYDDASSAKKDAEGRLEKARKQYEARAKTRGPKDPGFGTIYGSPETPSYLTPKGPVWMWRKGQKVRFYTKDGEQVGPEQRNVAPAMAFADEQGWKNGDPRIEALRPGQGLTFTRSKSASERVVVRFLAVPKA